MPRSCMPARGSPGGRGGEPRVAGHLRNPPRARRRRGWPDRAQPGRGPLSARAGGPRPPAWPNAPRRSWPPGSPPATRTWLRRAWRGTTSGARRDRRARTRPVPPWSSSPSASACCPHPAGDHQRPRRRRRRRPLQRARHPGVHHGVPPRPRRRLPAPGPPPARRRQPHPPPATTSPPSPPIQPTGHRDLPETRADKPDSASHAQAGDVLRTGNPGQASFVTDAHNRTSCATKKTQLTIHRPRKIGGRDPRGGTLASPSVIDPGLGRGAQCRLIVSRWCGPGRDGSVSGRSVERPGGLAPEPPADCGRTAVWLDNEVPACRVLPRCGSKEARAPAL